MNRPLAPSNSSTFLGPSSSSTFEQSSTISHSTTQVTQTTSIPHSKSIFTSSAFSSQTKSYVTSHKTSGTLHSTKTQNTSSKTTLGSHNMVTDPLTSSILSQSTDLSPIPGESGNTERIPSGSKASTIVPATVIPTVVIISLVLIVWLVRYRRKKFAEAIETRRQEANEFNFNPNVIGHDSALQSDDDGTNDGYRGWGARTPMRSPPLGPALGINPPAIIGYLNYTNGLDEDSRMHSGAISPIFDSQRDNPDLILRPEDIPGPRRARDQGQYDSFPNFRSGYASPPLPPTPKAPSRSLSPTLSIRSDYGVGRIRREGSHGSFYGPSSHNYASRSFSNLNTLLQAANETRKGNDRKLHSKHHSEGLLNNLSLGRSNSKARLSTHF